MLMQLGPVKFQIAPFNTTGNDHLHGADWAEKPVVGVMPPLEFVGEKVESWMLKAKLFPAAFGGMPDLGKLQQARASGLPQYLVRGDGVIMGWVAIEHVAERSSYLDRQGIGQVIEVDIQLRRASKPAAGLFFSIMQSIL